MNLPNSRGFTLIEMMIAMLVLATGIVGSIAIQTTAKKNTFDAVQRAQATALAHDILERIRGNKSELASYEGDKYGSEDWSNVKLCHSPQDTVEAVTCTPTELATYNKYQWNEALKGSQVTRVLGSGENEKTLNIGGLIDPTGCIDVTHGTDVNGNNVTNSGSVVVIVAWSGRFSTQDANTNSDFASIKCGATGTDNTRRQVEVSAYIY